MPLTVLSYIGGRWVGGGERRAIANPSDADDCVGVVELATPEDVHDACVHASASQSSWWDLGCEARAGILDRIASALMDQQCELGMLVARESGQLLKDAVAEVARAARIFRYFAGECVRNYGHGLERLSGRARIETRREPLGVVAAITPWNAPIAVPAWKVAPALAFGNSVVLKPSELTPAVAARLAEISKCAEMPDGVLNVVCGGAAVGRALVTDPLVGGITFTGSTEVGFGILKMASERTARVQLEMGGKNALVVLDDAHLATAVDCAFEGAFKASGQRCTASSRILVARGVHDEFVAALIARLRGVRVDHALSAEATMGPLISEAHLSRQLEYCRIGLGEGATLAHGGHALQRATRGNFFEPTLFVDTSAGMTINREEIFGPVASVIAVGDLEEAIEVVNATPYGLSAGLCTGALASAQRFRRSCRSGMVMVNLPTAGVDYHAPFGGIKASGYGPPEQGHHAREFFTTLKTCYTAE